MALQIDEALTLPPTGEPEKWERHSTTVALPENARYIHTIASFECLLHGKEDVNEGVTGHWFRFIAATWDQQKNTVRCECGYQVHDKQSTVVFHVHYRE